MRQPDFTQLLKVLKREVPDRDTLFEFFLNGPLYKVLANGEFETKNDGFDWARHDMAAFKNAGYDYMTISGTDFWFPTAEKSHKSSISLNEGFLITDRESFEKYAWPDPQNADYSRLEKLGKELPEGMKFIVSGPCGVLENTIAILGYDNMCLLSVDDPDFLQEVFDAVGSRLVTYYEKCMPYESVGACIGNDDWGFNTQPMLSPSDLRRYVFPWHKKIVEVAHKNGKPAILHSCGKLELVMDDIVNDMKYDGKHSYEDNILPIEMAYEKYVDQIALLGGIDLNFICRETPEKITVRSRAMLERADKRGGYALGTGNSVPEFVPQQNYFAMIKALRD